MAAISSTTNLQPQQSTVLSSNQIDNLPPELLNKIIQFVVLNGLPALSSSSKTLNNRVLSETNTFTRLSVQDFIKELNDKLTTKNRFPNQIESLKNIADCLKLDPNFNNTPNLMELKKSIAALKKELVSAIKSLGVEILDELSKEMECPNFMEDIFELAKIHSQIDAANLLSSAEIEDALYSIFEPLFNAGKIDLACQGAMLITNERYKSRALYFISQALTKKGNIDTARQVAMSITDEHRKSLALYFISQALTKKGDIDTARQVAMSITNEHYKSLALYFISRRRINS